MTLSRKAPMGRHKSELKSGEKKLRKPMKRNRKSIPATELAHYKAVASLPCVCCGIVGYSQAAHSNRYQDGKGLGIKANYLATFPLCCARTGIVGCHFKHDNCVDMTREEADRRTEQYISSTLRLLKSDSYE